MNRKYNPNTLQSRSQLQVRATPINAMYESIFCASHNHMLHLHGKVVNIERRFFFKKREFLQYRNEISQIYSRHTISMDVSWEVY